MSNAQKRDMKRILWNSSAHLATTFNCAVCGDHSGKNHVVQKVSDLVETKKRKLSEITEASNSSLDYQLKWLITRTQYAQGGHFIQLEKHTLGRMFLEIKPNSIYKLKFDDSYQALRDEDLSFVCKIFPKTQNINNSTMSSQKWVLSHEKGINF